MFLFSIYLTNGFIRNLNVISCFRDDVLYCFLQLSLNELVFVWLKLDHLFTELNYQILSKGYGGIILDKHIKELQ